MSTKERLSPNSSSEKIPHSPDHEGEGRALRARALVNCVDEASRPRVNSLDRHNQVLAKILKLFRASSDESVERPGSRSERGDRKKEGFSKSRSAECNVAAPHHARRFMRIVRDENAPPPETLDDNPYRIARYTQKFLETHYRQKSAEDDHCGDKRLPYITSGHTILKKASGDHLGDTSGAVQQEGGEPSPSAQKRATFFSEVEVIEYSMKDKVSTTRRLSSHVAPLRDSDEEDEGPSGSSDQLDHQNFSAGGLGMTLKGSEELMQTDDICSTSRCCDMSSDGLNTSDNAQELGVSECGVVKEMDNSYTNKSLQSIFTPILTINREGLASSKVHEPVTKHVRLSDVIVQQRV